MWGIMENFRHLISGRRCSSLSITQAVFLIQTSYTIVSFPLCGTGCPQHREFRIIKLYFMAYRREANKGIFRGKPFLVLVILVLLISVLLVQNYQQKEQPAPESKIENRDIEPAPLLSLELPAQRPGDQVIKHSGFTLAYNEQHETASWVAYKLTGLQTTRLDYERTDNYTPDPKVTTGTANDDDYKGSGYDRGHLAPAEDMAWSETTMTESFYYSNMAPQEPGFNRGVWRRLEELTRFWASYYDSVFIATGPVLTPGLRTIGAEEVSVPQYFYKVVLYYNNKNAKAIGFVMQNKPSAATLKSFAVPVDSVEKLTGLDFYPALPDDVENAVEANPDVSNWQWTRKNKSK